MKRFLLLLSTIFLLSGLFAQNNVGIGTNQPNPTALLHVDVGSNINGGFLITGEMNNNATIPSLSGNILMFYPGKSAFRAGSVDNGAWNNSQVGFFSTALGKNTLANGAYSTALGYHTTAGGLYSTATGYYTIASGEYSTALGNNSVASGMNSSAIGMGSAASGVRSIALGSGTASGARSTAIGFIANATGTGSTAIGQQTTASGINSMALGWSTTAKASGSISIGLYNNDTDAPNGAPTDRIFQIGNGSLEYGRSNAVTVLRNGNTGIGTLDPAYRLDLASRMRIRSGGTGSTSAGIWLNKNDNSGLLGFVGVDGNNAIGIFSNTSGWSFLINDVTGNAWVKGTVTANGVTLTSDERLKKDITPLHNTLPLLEKLNGYQYHWKDETCDVSLQTGLLAQEVEKVLPELVKTDGKGMKSVNYMGLIPYMLEALKAQQRQIDELKQLVLELAKK